MMIDRREFLGRIAAGGTTLAMPLILPGCATQSEPVVEQPVPDNLFSSWFGIEQPSVSQVMSQLTNGSADFADAFFQVSSHNRIVFENGVVTEAASESRQGAALRVVNGSEVGFATTQDLGLPALLDAARTASRGGVSDAAFALTMGNKHDLYAVGLPWSRVAQARKVGVLEYLDRQTRAQEGAVESVLVRWDDVEEHVMIATADGELVSDTRPLTRLTLIVTAQRGEARQTGFAGLAVRDGIEVYSEERLNALVTEAIERTMIQFEARRAPAGELPVVLAAGTGGVLLHEAIGHHFEADFVQAGSSAYAGRLGDGIAESMVTLVEDTSLPGEPGALNFDDEAAETGRTVLVENGVLRSFVHDRLTARAFGVAPTGSGRRGSFEHMPLPRLTSTFLENGPHSRDEIIASLDRAVVCETFSGGQADIESGDFDFTVKNGWLVEKGQVTGPTKDFRIAGNSGDLLGRITMLGDDSRMDPAGWICGKQGRNLPVSHGAPTMLVSGLAVSPL